MAVKLRDGQAVLADERCSPRAHQLCQADGLRSPIRAAAPRVIQQPTHALALTIAQPGLPSPRPKPAPQTAPSGSARLEIDLGLVAQVQFPGQLARS